MPVDRNVLSGYLHKGKLMNLPSKREKRLIALIWICEHISPKKDYSEREFNELLDKLHTFHDSATLRRELCDSGLVKRSADGKCYRLNHERPPQERLLAEAAEEKKTTAAYSEREKQGAADFRNGIHAEALRRVQLFRSDITSVVDRYGVEDYFQQHWDYPGAWYTIVAIPESAGSREALIDQIVRDTLSKNW